MSDPVAPALPIVACVDDFGLAPAVNRAVLALAGRGAISATSCMVNMAQCTGPALREILAADIDVGLHLNFSEGVPISASLRRHWPRFPALGALLGRAHAGLLPLAAVADECRAQVDRFVELAGRAPDFLDGHQHVHHLPGIRAGWLALEPRFAPACYVRDTASLRGPGFGIKCAIIRGTGARALRRELRARGRIAAGPLFGSYDLSGREYGVLMRRWLAALRAESPTGLLFCHPADATDGERATDSVGAARRAEWQYFASSAWADDRAAVGVHVVRGAAAFGARGS